MAIRQSRGITLGKGTPQRLEGQNGDITIRSSRKGLKLYVKESNKWHSVDLDIDLRQIASTVRRLEDEVKRLSTKTNNTPVVDKLLLRQSGGTSAVGIQNKSGLIAFRNSTDTSDATVLNPKIRGNADGSDNNPVVDTQTSNIVKLAYNDDSSNFVVRLIHAATGSIQSMLSFFNGAIARWSIGYSGDEQDVLKISAASNLDSPIFQFTDSGISIPSGGTGILVRNDEGSTIPVGAPLYSKGEVGGSSRIKVGICDANDSAKMPCIGIANAEMNTSDTKDNYGIVSGVYNTNINGFTGLAVGDILYVSNTGDLTKTKPSNPDDLIQNVGIVLKTNGTICQGLLVSAIGRTNDVPNVVYTTVTSSSDAIDVSGVTAVECDTSGGHIRVGGFSGGVQGQIVHVLKSTGDAYRVIVEHDETPASGVSQRIFTSGASDITIAAKGGITCYCTGSEWIALDKWY